MSHDSNLFGRPYGYAADHPVAVRLGDRDCFLGNEAAATPACDREFDRVLSLTREPKPRTTDHHPLTDDDANDWREFAAACDTARDLLRAEGSTLIHCRAGVSRSAAVAAAAIAASEHRPFVDALHGVQDARPHAIPHPALHALGVQYVAGRA
jgi:hypothetical protein